VSRRPGWQATASAGCALTLAFLAGCASTPGSSDAAVPAGTAASSPASASALTPQERVAFFVDHARHGDLDEVSKEIDAGIDVNQRDSLDQTALIAAVSHRSEDVVALLLEHHADPNIADNAGWTPLIYGAYFGADPSLLQRLIDHGAQINARNGRGITALFLASASGHEVQVKFLLDKGADRSIASAAGYTPERIAELKGLGRIVALLNTGSASSVASGGSH